MSALKKPPSRFEYGGYYLDNPHPERGGGWYACRYDPVKRAVSRRSLKTADFEQAKSKLVSIVDVSPVPEDEAPGPNRVKIISVLDVYAKDRGSLVASNKVVDRVHELVVQYLREKSLSHATVSIWTPSRQFKFCEWLSENHKHTPATMQRYLSVMGSAFIYATKVAIRDDGLGREVEGAMMTYAPKIAWKEASLRKAFNLPAKKPATFVPSLDEMATFVDALGSEGQKRWALLALSTWARPEAVTDFDPYVQWDRRTNVIDLDKPGRAQTNKRRARIVCCRTLAASLEGWMQPRDFPETEWLPAQHMDRPPILLHRRERIDSVANSVRGITRALGFPHFTQKTTRTFMATMVRKLAPNVPREKRSMWLGHIVQEGSRTTDFYEIADPDYLADVALATDYVIQRILARVSDKSFAVEVLLNDSELRRIGVQPEANFVSDQNTLAIEFRPLISAS